ncbi:hypothetical protein BH20ACT5_BH20ACT5_13760 [soil metagenome]
MVIDAGRRLRPAFPIRSVVSVSRPGWDRRGDDGKGHGMVRIILDGPALARRLGQQIAVRQLTVSVDDPDLLTAVVTNRGKQQQRH